MWIATFITSVVQSSFNSLYVDVAKTSDSRCLKGRSKFGRVGGYITMTRGDYWNPDVAEDYYYTSFDLENCRSECADLNHRYTGVVSIVNYLFGIILEWTIASSIG